MFWRSAFGVRWSLLQSDFPPTSAVKYYFYRWRDEDLDDVIHYLLRAQTREKAGRTENPSAVAIDTPSLPAAAGVPATVTGIDTNNTVSGIKRGLAVDVMGLVIAVAVMAASVHNISLIRLRLTAATIAVAFGSDARPDGESGRRQLRRLAS